MPLSTARKVSYILLVADTLLCCAIVFRVNYTEIDWKAYMQQVEIFLAGERDYGLIKGDTGPLVYPAGHVYLYTGLYWLTNHGKSIVTAQSIFAVIYLCTLAVTLATYRYVKAPYYIFPLLILSKRLHSIYILRLFNDGISAFLMSISTLNYVKDNFIIGSLFFTLAVSVKMNALLYLSAILLLLVQGRGVTKTLRHLAIMLQIQLLLAGPFLIHSTSAYFTKAFEFSRTFMYKWTVNWRFVDEQVFLSSSFSAALLAGHVLTMIWFAATRWNRPSRKSLISLLATSIRTTLGLLFPTGDDDPMARMEPSFVLVTLYVSNLIGIVFARSAHYQFYSWFAFSMPYLLYKTGLTFPIQLALWAVQEWAWNVYPSTKQSSFIVVAIPCITLLAVWLNTGADIVGIVKQESTGRRTPVKRKRRTL